MDYYQLKGKTLDAVSHIGVAVPVMMPSTIEWLSQEQRSRLHGKNFVTDEKWQFRLLAGRSILVEISYGRFLDDPILGLTVFHKGEAATWDHERSKACFSVAELVEALTVLNAGREVEA
jgi:hypothetical protein